MKNETLKIMTNVPEIITFQFDDFKTGTGQYGQWYMYTVENRGVNKTFFPSEHLHQLLQTIGNLQGKTLEIVKYEDGNFKNWKIVQNGLDITPKIIASTGSKPEEKVKNSLEERLNKAAAKFAEIEARVKRLEDELFQTELDKI